MTQRILAIDTATEACSAALLIGDSLLSRLEIAPRRHGRLILPMVESLLAEAGTGLAALDAIAFGRGPGAFTGLRIAASVTQALAFAVDRPVVPVSTLAAMAWGAWRERGEDRLLAAIDARMAEVYWAAYAIRDGQACRLGDESVVPPGRVVVPETGRWFGIGTAWSRYAEELHGRLPGRLRGWAGEAFPEARYIAELARPLLDRGEVVAAADALPVYLRDDVAKRPTG